MTNIPSAPDDFDPSSFTPYIPTSQDAIMVWWSYTWRNMALSVIVMLPLMIFFMLYLAPEIKEGMDEAQIKVILEEFSQSIMSIYLVLLFFSFCLNVAISYVALRETLKIQFDNFSFVKFWITPRDLLIMSLTLNGFATMFGLLGSPSTMAGFSLFIFLGIQFFVSWAILWQFMSSGLFGVRLPLVERE